MAGEMVEFTRTGSARPGLQPGRELCQRHHPGRILRNRRGRRGEDDGDAAASSGRRGDDRPGGQPAGRGDGQQRPRRGDALPGGRVDGPGRGRPAAGGRAAADRHQVHRRHDADRPRPARTHHRRPQNGQNRHRRRHDHQPEGRERRLRLRRHRPEGIDGGPGGGEPARRRRDGLHHRRLRVGGRRRPAAVHRALRRLRHGRILHVRAGPRHAGGLRRPEQAGGGLPPAVAAGAAAAGTRGLPRRHFLRPFAPAGAVGQGRRALGDRAAGCRREIGDRGLGRQQRAGRTAAAGREGQGLRRPAGQGARRQARPAEVPRLQAGEGAGFGRFADGLADHRDAGRRGVGLHSDERDFHHGRADLPATGVGPGRHLAGDGRGHFGVRASAARRRSRP